MSILTLNFSFFLKICDSFCHYFILNGLDIDEIEDLYNINEFQYKLMIIYFKKCVR